MKEHPVCLWIQLFVLPLLLLGVFTAACNSSPGKPAASPEASGPQKPGESVSKPQSLITRPDIGFASHQRLVEHYEKHGREFGAITMEEYLQQAQELRDRPAGGPVLELARSDGVIVRFDRKSKAFIAFNPNGVIRTYFRPNDGEAYFKRQARRKG